MSESTPVPSQLRPMGYPDLGHVLAWRNHPEVRLSMYTQHEITLEEHLRWFERALQDPNRHLLIFELHQQPMGFVNFNAAGNGGIADWGFYLAPSSPKGIGQQLGRAALYHAFSQLKFHKVCGQVLAYNQRSREFHIALGFIEEGCLRDQHFDGERYHHVNCFGILSNQWHHNK